MLKNMPIIRRIDPFLIVLIGVVAAASLLPVRGAGVPIADGIADAAIMFLFFLHGAKLSRAAILAGIVSWRVHLLVMVATFVLFPLLGLGVFYSRLSVDPALLTGILFLTLLPSTVQSSVAFTAIARGNVAAAVCSASISNMAGILLTPLLTSLLIGGSAAASAESVRTIAVQLLLPFAAGHLCRPLIVKFLDKHKAIIGKVDRGSILIVVYNAFSAAVVGGIWQRLSPLDLAILMVICAILLAAVMLATWFAALRAGLSVEDRIVVLFCGSKKSLVSGVPMASALFPAAVAGPVILPLMLFHQLQLMVCAVIAQRYRDQADVAVDGSALAPADVTR
ncbi:MAG: bile acid:sodium symporter family protein [Sphingobium sp.]